VESFKAEGNQIVETLKALIHEGNIRRVVVESEGRTVAEFPLTAGAVGVLLAPVLASRASSRSLDRRQRARVSGPRRTVRTLRPPVCLVLASSAFDPP
jgi:hypothetical protein